MRLSLIALKGEAMKNIFISLIISLFISIKAAAGYQDSSGFPIFPKTTATPDMDNPPIEEEDLTQFETSIIDSLKTSNTKLIEVNFYIPLCERCGRQTITYTKHTGVEACFFTIHSTISRELNISFIDEKCEKFQKAFNIAKRKTKK